MSQEGDKIPILSPAAIDELIRVLCERIAHSDWNTRPLAIVGIHRGGVPLAKRIFQRLQALGIGGAAGNLNYGSIDTSFNRDDLGSRGSMEIFPNEIDFEIEGLDILLVDDVISSGRTIRAGLNALMQLGRPHSVRLAVLVDRGCRQLPIQPDFCALKLVARDNEKISLHLDLEDPSHDSLHLVKVTEIDTNGGIQ